MDSCELTRKCNNSDILFDHFFISLLAISFSCAGRSAHFRKRQERESFDLASILLSEKVSSDSLTLSKFFQPKTLIPGAIASKKSPFPSPLLLIFSIFLGLMAR